MSGGGLRCGMCLETFKSYLRLQHHKANIHGEKNQMSRWTKGDIESKRKENLTIAEERLKEAISKYRYYHS